MRLKGASDREAMRETGTRLRAAREAQGLTLAAVAARVGLSQRTLQRAEAGENPTLLTLLRLFRLYGRLTAFDAVLPRAAEGDAAAPRAAASETEVP